MADRADPADPADAADATALAIYGHLVRARARSQLQYRASFAMLVTSQLLASALDVLVLVALFGHVDALAGWSAAEAAFLYGTGNLSFDLCDALVGQVDYVFVRVRSGTFDNLLIRPLGVMGQLLADEFALRRLAKLAPPVAVLAYGIATVDVDWTPARAIWVAVMVVSGAAIFGSIWVVGSCLAFWTTEGSEVTNAFTAGGRQLVTYPMAVYDRWLQRAALIVPLAFVNSVPAAYVLGRAEPLGLPPAARFASPAVAVVSMGVARMAWRAGVRHYRSTGS